MAENVQLSNMRALEIHLFQSLQLQDVCLGKYLPQKDACLRELAVSRLYYTANFIVYQSTQF